MVSELQTRYCHNVRQECQLKHPNILILQRWNDDVAVLGFKSMRLSSTGILPESTKHQNPEQHLVSMLFDRLHEHTK